MQLFFSRKFFLIFILASLGYCKQAFAVDFEIVTPDNKVSIFYDTECPLDSIAANLLASDIESITGYRPFTSKDITRASGNIVIIGSIHSQLISQFRNKINLDNLKDKWECYGYRLIKTPIKNIKNALIICGSDFRGTAYGVFDLSARLGVSPWYWWADVTPTKSKRLAIDIKEYTSAPPSVKFRGIFINDEDWGLQPWAAKTFEPETGDIGPKTYAKVFELLLRLKANLIWPAMHPSTKAFFHYPGNAKVAEDYQIVIGSSHAEPMLRNNVGEWDEKTMGHFNYLTNKETVYKYWEDRVKESRGINAMFTIGMRGVHDSGIEGVKDPKDAVPLLERIFNDERGLLARYINKDSTAVPQVFTAYKEVLDIYDNGLKVPEDVTLVWPDDNYGYIQRLNNEKEKKRLGGSGVYYHASYWGRPHDYLWLSSTHPSLIREEMMKAYETGASNLWVLNVGDIKPLEYNIEEFMDMAYDAAPFSDSRYVRNHLLTWVRNIFGKADAPQIENILWQYYQLAFERRPEFMGWSQTEPTTKTNYTAYNHFYFGDEAQQRIDQYESLQKEVQALRGRMDAKRADAFYELVYYPVVGASLMNKKFLYRDKAVLYAKQARLSAQDYASLSKAAYDSIVKETVYYNTKLAGGKWNGIMSFKPRDLPVYQSPEIPAITIDSAAGWRIAPEGFVTKDSSLVHTAATMMLPKFDDVHKQHYFIDIFLSSHQTVSWTAAVSHPWIRLSQSSGLLQPQKGKNQRRIWVTIDWGKMPQEEPLSGHIIFKGGGKEMVVDVQGRKVSNPGLSRYKGFIENNGFVSIHAAHFTRQSGKQTLQWQVIDGLGYTGKTMQALPLSCGKETLTTDTEAIKQNNGVVEYDFYTVTPALAQVSIFTLPTHPLNNNYRMRYAVSVDGSPLQLVDFKTVGRSEEWKQHVLRNRAEQTIQLPFLDKGNHTLKIYCVDPGVALDEIRIDLGGLKKAYSVIPETKLEEASKTAWK